MKIYKRAAIVLASALALSTTVPLGASTITQEMSSETQLTYIAKAQKKSTDNVVKPGTGKDQTKPKIWSITTKDIKGDTYLLVDVTDDVEMDYITVDGKKVTDKYSKDVYQYKITKSGTYTIIAYDRAGNSTKEDKKITINNGKPTVDLSKRTSKGKTYLVIKASDDGKINKVTINGDKFSFPSSGGTEEYEVTTSDTYEVIVKDDDGNETKKSLKIELDDAPTVKLSQKEENGKYYLIIDVKPDSGRKISSVRVNGKLIDCDKKGEELKYEVTKTDTYKVVVRDSEGVETTKELKITVKESSGTQKPTLSLAPISENGIQYIFIQALDDTGISKLTVNGINVPISSGGGSVKYPVTASGVYKVVATDKDGNETTKEITMTVGNITSTNTFTPNGSTHTVVFKLNSKSYTLDGAAQSMDSAVIARNGRTYIPIRYLSNALGIPNSNIQWDKNTKSVVINDGSNVVKVPLNKKTMTLNGQSIAIDSAVIEVNRRVMVPISQVSKAFTYKNVNIRWDSANKQAIITRK